jgi:hypothetical protein
MWETKTFKTREAMRKWVTRHGHTHQWEEIFINNGYGVECRKLQPIRMPR